MSQAVTCRQVDSDYTSIQIKTLHVIKQLKTQTNQIEEIYAAGRMDGCLYVLETTATTPTMAQRCPVIHVVISTKAIISQTSRRNTLMHL